MIFSNAWLVQYLQLGADSYERGQEGTGDQTESAPEDRGRKMKSYENRGTQRGREDVPGFYLCSKDTGENKTSSVIQSVCVYVRLTDRGAVECWLSTVGGLGVY